jgi:predicted CoA-binding protein
MTKKKKKTLDILEPYKKWAQLGLVFQNQFKINADQAAKIIEQLCRMKELLKRLLPTKNNKVN